MNTKNIYKLISILLAFLISFTVCGKGKQSLTVAGSTAFQPFAEKLADQYMQINPKTSIIIQGGGSAVGIQSTLSGAAQIGMADMVELPPEAKSLTATAVARDGIAVIVNTQNKVNNLTLQQIRDIYNGRIKNWSMFGGHNGTITVISREAGSGTRSSFEAIVKNISLTKEAIIQDSNGTVRETVINDRNAIGYLSHGLINDKIKPLTVNGVACTTDEIRKGRYTLVRPIYLLTKNPPRDKIKNFIDYILSDQGQGTIKSSGLIPAK